MPFTWRAALLAPLILPLLTTGAFFVVSPPPSGPMPFGQHLFFCMLFFAIGALISFAATWGLLLPGLFLASRHLPAGALNGWLAAAVGLAAGFVVYLAHLWVWHKSSGPNSGPPEETSSAFLRLHFDLLSWDAGFILACGVVTALLYWGTARHVAR